MMFKTRPGERLTIILLGAALFALYLVTHPYRGIHADALIYVTRAWAPRALVEGDMLFAHEHQTGLTLYGSLLQLLMSVMPVAEAARALALCGVALWFAGLLYLSVALARAAQLAPLAALAMAALALLSPLGYSAGSSFMAGEFLSVPRPFAEAFVLVAFAAMIEGRRVAGVLALVIACAFHPLMGLAGLAIAFVWAANSDRRLWLLAPAGVCLAFVAAAFGAPFVSPLLATFEPEWLALLRMRTSYLFLSEAPASFWVDVLLRGAILLIAARICAGAVRAFLTAILIASAGGLAISLLFADMWPSILITQLQPWRVLFVPAVVAPLAVVLIALKGEGRPTRITLALIACAYMTRDASILSPFFSIGALAFHFKASAASASPRVEALLWIIAAAAWIGFDLLNLVALSRMSLDAFQWSYLWVLRPLSLPLAALVIIVALRGQAPRASIAAGLAMIAAALALVRFDDRAPVDRLVESRQAPDLLSAIPFGEGPVLWIGPGKEPWYWLGRPNWAAPLQASSIVFSRDLAREWEERTRFLIDHGVFEPEVLRNQAAPLPRAPSHEAVAAVCNRADAPSGVISPLLAGDAAPEGARSVPAPAKYFQLRPGDSVRFEEITAYAIWSCAELRR